MIDGLGRGQQEGALKASELGQDLPVEEIQSLAVKRFAVMDKQGYAHIEPQEKFIRGFVQGYGEQRLLVALSL